MRMGSHPALARAGEQVGGNRGMPRPALTASLVLCDQRAARRRVQTLRRKFALAAVRRGGHSSTSTAGTARCTQTQPGRPSAFAAPGIAHVVVRGAHGQDAVHGGGPHLLVLQDALPPVDRAIAILAAGILHPPVRQHLRAADGGSCFSCGRGERGQSFRSTALQGRPAAR